MRPYAAVIWDSFRAAFSSRVLWVAFIAIYVFLIAIAPIGYREVYTTDIRWTDLAQNGTRLKYMLAKDLDPSRQTPAGQIARAMPEELKSNLRKVADGNEVRIGLELFSDALTHLLDRDDWYDAKVWANTVRLRELRELDETPDDSLEPDLKRRRNRLRIEAALPGVFENRGARSIALTYAGIEFPAFFQLDPAQFRMVLNHFVLRIIIDWLLGFIMIFLGILVTASIVPDMLQPGSLHLLLSKPVSRPLLFLSKFFGGCAFVLLCVTQLIVGLWLISGMRLGIWNARLLYCIPVCVFLFAVFYSVSAVSGLRWRSPILSIAITNIFGALCLVIGIAGGIADGFIDEPDRIESMVVSGDTLIAATRGAKLRRYDEATNQWQDLFPDEQGHRGDRLMSPVPLGQNKVVTARVRGGRMNWFGSGATPILLLEKSNQWKPMQSNILPASTSQLFVTREGQLIAASSGEVSMFTGTLESADESEQPLDNPTTDSGNGSNAHGEPQERQTAPVNGARSQPNIFNKLLQMMGAATAGFQPITPTNFPLSSPRSIELSQLRDDCYIASTGRLTLFSRQQNHSDWAEQYRMAIDLGTRGVWLTLGKDYVIVFRQKMIPLAFTRDLQPLELQFARQWDWEKTNLSSVAYDEAVNALALITIDGQAHFMRADADSSNKTLSVTTTSLNVSDADTVIFDQEHLCWVSHQVDCVTAFDTASLERLQTVRPSVQGWRKVGRYVLTPLRSVTPQTGELSETIAAIVSGEDAIQIPFEDDGEATERYAIWRPVLTCAGFIVFMLSIGCIYFTRTDF